MPIVYSRGFKEKAPKLKRNIVGKQLYLSRVCEKCRAAIIELSRIPTMNWRKRKQFRFESWWRVSTVCQDRLQSKILTMNIHRYIVSYLWCSFITNSVGSPAAISHTLRPVSAIRGAFIANRESWSGWWISLARAHRENWNGDGECGRRQGWKRGMRLGHHVLSPIEHVSHSVRRARSRMLCVQQLNGISVFDSTESTRFVEERKWKPSRVPTHFSLW